MGLRLSAQYFAIFSVFSGKKVGVFIVFLLTNHARYDIIAIRMKIGDCPVKKEQNTEEKTTMKKLLIIALALMLALSLVACGDKNGNEKVYISQISSSTLLKRTGYVDSLTNV